MIAEAARHLWLQRQEARVRCWRRLRIGWQLVMALILIGGLGTTWYACRPESIEEFKMARVLARIEMDGDFHALPATERQKVLEDVRTGRVVPSRFVYPNDQGDAESERELQPKRRMAMMVVIVVLVGLGWTGGLVVLAATHSLARWMDRYPG
jgi:hypothetical protein